MAASLETREAISRGNETSSHGGNVVLLLGLFCMVRAIQFEIEAGRETCLAEELGEDVLIIGAYKVSPAYTTQMFMKVIDPNNVMIWKNEDADQGSFSFTTETFGKHQVCFLPMARRGQTLNPTEKRHVVLDLKIGVDAANYDDIALKENLSPLQVELRKLEDQMIELNQMMTYMRGREAQMRDTNESTNARVLWLSIISMSVLVGLGLWQIFYLKRYFKSKKLI